VLYWPVPCLLTIELARLWHASGKHARVALALALGLVLTIASLYTLRLAVRLRTSNPTEISLQRGGIYVRPDEASVITKAVHYIHEHGSPSDAVAILPYFPVLHFLADRRSPHRSAYILWPVPEFPDRDQRVIRALESSGTDVLVYELNHFLEFPRVADYAPALFDYLVDHFEIDRILSDARMGLKLATARRVRNAASGREVLSGSLDGSELLVVSAAGEAHAIDSASRSLYLQRDRWPLRRVIALRPTSGGGRTLLRVPLSIRPGETLHTAAMIRPDVWGAFHPSWIQFRVAIREGGVERTYIEKRIDSQRNSSDRHWFEMDLDVSDFEGREVELRAFHRRPESIGRETRDGRFRGAAPSCSASANDLTHPSSVRERRPEQPPNQNDEQRTADDSGQPVQRHLLHIEATARQWRARTGWIHEEQVEEIDRVAAVREPAQNGGQPLVPERPRRSPERSRPEFHPRQEPPPAHAAAEPLSPPPAQ